MDRIIHRVSEALVDLRQDYIKWPTANEMDEIKTNFEAIGGFPGFPRIIGVIDCTRIGIRAHSKHPEAYVNRKKFHSLR
ncbi:hypothetical protein QZH41_020371 [Actinostola sp. cb2023]|nr:hypothetical protein QZH41_020371 [Actinostola sp. cb2023]